MSDDEDQRVYIKEAAGLLNREMGTLRKWEYSGILPKHLAPKRGVRGWRYWTPKQIDDLKDWLEATDRRSGKGLPYWNPTEEQVAEAMRKMRRPKKPTEEEVARDMEKIVRSSKRKTTITKKEN
jgi:hypothetical protein